MDRALPRRLSLIGCAAVLAVGGVSLLPHSNWWWGVNALHFLPLPVRLGGPIVACLLLVALGWPPGPRTAAIGEPSAEPGPAGPARLLDPAWAGVVAGLAALPVLHLLRARHFLLGDGAAILNHLALKEPLETRSALFDLLAPAVVAVLESWRGAGVSLQRAGLVSTLMGGVLTGLVTAVLTARARGGRGASALALAPLLLLQPALQLFCGYIETYSFLAAALIVYYLLLADSAEGRRGPAAPVVGGVLAFVSHPFGALAWPGLLMGRPRHAGGRLALAAPLLALALLALLFRIPGLATGPARWLDPVATLGVASGIVTESLTGRGSFRFLAVPAAVQAADLVNHLLLTAAPALVLLGALAADRSTRRAFATRGALAVLAGAAGFVVLRAALRTPLGAPRDWDLFAPAGIGLTAWAGTVLAAHIDATIDRSELAPASVGRLAAQLTILGLVFTAPWLALQIRPALGVDRHLSILEGHPRLEAAARAAGHTVMGDRFTWMGQSYLAAQAYRAAYGAQPGFDNAWRSGVAYMACGRIEDAGGAFRECARLSPRDWRVWNELGNALTGLNEFARADSALRRSITLNPRMPDPRIHLARSLALQGLNPEARAMLESARPLLDPRSRVMKDFQKLDENLGKTAP